MAVGSNYEKRAADMMIKQQLKNKDTDLAPPVQGDLFQEGWGEPHVEAMRSVSPWLRVPARDTLIVAVLSEKPVRFWGHWDNRRMQLCMGNQVCGYCKIGHPLQQRWAICVYVLEQNLPGFLELGAKSAEDLQCWADQRGSFRGMVVKFHKENGVKTGRIVVKLADNSFINPGELPAALDVAGALRASFSRLREGTSLN